VDRVRWSHQKKFWFHFLVTSLGTKFGKKKKPIWALLPIYLWEQLVSSLIALLICGLPALGHRQTEAYLDGACSALDLFFFRGQAPSVVESRMFGGCTSRVSFLWALGVISFNDPWLRDYPFAMDSNGYFGGTTLFRGDRFIYGRCEHDSPGEGIIIRAL